MATAASGRTDRNSASFACTSRSHQRKRLTDILQPRLLPCRLTALSLIIAGILPVHALSPNALPTSGSVASGTSSISTSGNTMNIQQTSAKTIINWDSFNIGSAATVNFKQPGESSVALNRVSAGGGASEIAGRLNANGQVFLVNPTGILFSKTAQVNVGGLVASTLGISNSDFNAGGDKKFTGGATAGSITNLGQIKAHEEGYVVLLAPTVSNQGTISARLGTVAMAGGDKITLSFDEEQLINLTITKAALDTLIENKNIIRADGGLILLTAGAANSLASATVNNEGLLQAQRVSNNNGVIRLEAAGANSAVTLSGQIQAQDGSAFAKAATVTVAGDIQVDAANLTLNGQDSLLINAVLDLGGTPTNLGLVAGSGGIVKGNAGLIRMGGGTLSIYTDGDASLVTENLGRLAGFDSNANSAINIRNTGGDIDIAAGTIPLDPGNSGTRYEITGFDTARYLINNVQHNVQSNQGGLTLFNFGGGSVTVSEKISSPAAVELIAVSGSITVNKPIDAGGALALAGGTDANVNARLDGDSIELLAGENANFSAQAQLFSHGNSAPQDNPNDALIVATQVFNNQRGPDLFNTQPGTRWLVYSADPAANTKGGLVADFKRYDCDFCSTVPMTGNGFLYSIAPTLVITPDGMHAIYGDAHSLTGLAYTANGFIDGDTIAVLSGNATFDSSMPLTNRSPVGGYDIRYSTGLANELGYKIVGNTASTGEYVIDPRTLHVGATGANKVYDGNTLAAATLSDDRIAGDVLSSSYSGASFADKNAGSGKTVTVSGIGISGTDAGNYVVATNTANPTVATTSADIGQATLHVSGLTGVDKVFDNTPALPAAAGQGFTVAGKMASDQLKVTAAAAYDSSLIGARTVVISATTVSGADAGNYFLKVSDGSGQILQSDSTPPRPPLGSSLVPLVPTDMLAAFLNSLPPTAAGPATEGRDECRDDEMISLLITVSHCGVKRQDD